MTQTAVEWLVDELGAYLPLSITEVQLMVEQAKEMEQINTDNKVIHFAEWLTKKHTLTLISLYEKFEEEYYNETFNNLTKTQNDTINLALESVDLISKAFSSAKKFKNKL
jgi:ABC-type phosphate/phosphonate transport system ATPase subunit